MIDCSLGDDGVATHLDQCTFTCDDGYRRKYGTSWLRKCIVYRGYARWTGRTTVCVGMSQFLKLQCNSNFMVMVYYIL